MPNIKVNNTYNRLYSSAARYGDYELIRVSAPANHVLHAELNRPEKRNAISFELFREIGALFNEITADQHCRAVVLSGSGQMFCAGIDYGDMLKTMGSLVSGGGGENVPNQRDDIASRSKLIKNWIAQLQSPFNAIAKCPKPVIAAIHSGCIGAGVDMISAVDVRYASRDAYFSIREVGIGMAADVGTLQRLPKIVGNDSLVREIAFTGEDLPAQEAKDFGLVSRLYESPEACIQEALNLAKRISTRSPVAVQGTKISLNYSRDHTVEDGLEFMQIWNMSMLQSEDLITAVSAVANKDESPEFADL